MLQKKEISGSLKLGKFMPFKLALSLPTHSVQAVGTKNEKKLTLK